MPSGRPPFIYKENVRSMEVSRIIDHGWTVGVFGVIYDDHGRVLISERRDGKGWNLPGGGAKSRDLIYELAREVMEETGLQVVGQPILLNQYPSEELKDMALLYIVKISGEPVASVEALRHVFIDRDTLQREIKLVSQDFPGHRSGRMWAMVTDALQSFPCIDGMWQKY